MAVVVYKDGQPERVEPHRLQQALDSGYTLEKNPKPKRGRPPKIEETTEETTESE